MSSIYLHEDLVHTETISLHLNLEMKSAIGSWHQIFHPIIFVSIIAV
jgi:hypothetical protein